MENNSLSIKFWKGSKNRGIKCYAPCPCGCDTRDNPDLLGYLSGSNDKGDGFTILIEDKESYNKLREIFPFQED
tara:strand:- start:20 stop:241 length:222 start_codon:yes stop_codon:yes gene_type:complete